MAAESRKYGASLLVTTQAPHRLARVDGLLDNFNVLLAYQLGRDDATLLADYLPPASPSNLMFLDPGSAYLRAQDQTRAHPVITLKTNSPDNMDCGNTSAEATIRRRSQTYTEDLEIALERADRRLNWI